jgi:short-chain fatty acids transporter
LCADGKEAVVQRISGFFVTVMQRYLPDPWLFAIVLTLVVLLMGIGLTDSSALAMVRFWGEGFFNLLEFAMQMVLILVTGHVLVNTAVFKRALQAVAGRVQSAPSAIIIITAVAIVLCWLNWAVGLIGGALLAREMARQVRDLDYRLAIASSYTGFLVWHGGVSGSIPLLIATPDHFLVDEMGTIPISETIFARYNLFIAIALLVVLPVINRLMLGPPEKRFIVDPALLEEEVPERSSGTAASSPAEWLEKKPFLPWIIGIGGLIYLVQWFAGGGSLDLNIVIFIFLIAGIILHATPQSFLEALANAVRGTGGIILQFPFYAGIMGMMTASGLVAVIAGWFVAIATPTTLPFWSFISGGIVNFFVPSGGGQWAVQGPVQIEAAQQVGADLGKVAMGVAWGDAWTNMVQPFWLLPALAIAGLKARDVMGYCVMALIVSGIVIGVGLLLI